MERKAKAFGLYLIGAALVTIGVLGHRWWSFSDHDAFAGVGLREMQMCLKDQCDATSLTTLADGYPTFVYSGMLTYFAGLAAVLVGLVGAGVSLGKKPRTGATSPAYVAMLLFAATAIGTIVFQRSLPGLSGGPSLSYGMPATLIGAICGVVAMRTFDRAHA